MKDITDTGIRGYLKWLQRDQPAVYRIAAPHIAQRVPGAFSDHEQSLALGALFDTTGGAVPGVTTYFGDDSTDTTGASSGVQPDVATAANTGAASPSIISDIANLVTQAAQAVKGYQLTQAQINTYNQLNQQQLQRAASANTPLTISSSSLGIPLLSSASPGTILGGGVVAAGAAFVAMLWLLGAFKK